MAPAYRDVVRRYQRGYPTAPSLLPPQLEQLRLGSETWHEALSLVSNTLFGVQAQLWEASRLPAGCMLAAPPGLKPKGQWSM